jgi:hypothetical protein
MVSVSTQSARPSIPAQIDSLKISLNVVSNDGKQRNYMPKSLREKIKLFFKHCSPSEAYDRLSTYNSLLTDIRYQGYLRDIEELSGYKSKLLSSKLHPKEIPLLSKFAFEVEQKICHQIKYNKP